MPTTPLRFDTTEDANRVTVRFPADTELTENNAEELHRVLSAAVAGREPPHLVVDLSGITVLTSVILSKLLAVNKAVRAAGGHFALSNPTPTVLMVFKVTRLDTVLDIQTAAPVVPA